MPAPTGAMRERLLIQTADPVAVTISTLTRSGTTATATTASAHGYASNHYVTIAGAVPTGYNGRVKITVVDAVSFTYTVASGLTTPATGTMTVSYTSDPLGGRVQTWTTVDTVWAELLPVRAMERLQAQAVAAQIAYRFRVRTRADVTAKMRAVWTPTWPATATAQTLEIHGVLPFEHGRQFALLECGRVQ